MTKEEKKAAKAAKKAAKKEKGTGILAEFKAFINRGNVLDMAVGVIMASAFGAIVTAFTNILLSVATWGVPGGLNGLVTVLPAANDIQRGIAGIGQKFAAADLVPMTIAYAASQGVTIDATSDTFIQWQNSLLTKYTLYGQTYCYNMSAVINWGALINAVISFLIIALTLFIILKAVNSVKKKNAEIKARALEEYYEKHPEERPAPVEEGAPVPTELDILIEIRDELKAGKAAE